MEYRRLGRSDIRVSPICLGTMTWGEQNTEADAHQQLDMALNQGVNFIDAAEMYPVPSRKETAGLTETYIGTWLATRKNRDQVVLATKVVGPSSHMPWIRNRNGRTRLNRENILEALEGSLKRLQTDYIDLYQLHWPDRHTNYFGQLGYTPDPDETLTPVEETLAVLDEVVCSGKVRTVGLSNETPWGAMKFLHLSEQRGWPRMVSIQNPYSLLNRTFEIGLAEVALREDCGLLAYSPLAFGTLSGKYQDGHFPPGARLSRCQYFDRYSNPQAEAATREYVRLARESGLSPAQMALAFVNTRPFMTSNIIGATTPEQLQENLDSVNVRLTPDVLAQLEAIQTRYPNPSP